MARPSLCLTLTRRIYREKERKKKRKGGGEKKLRRAESIYELMLILRYLA